MKKIIIPLLFLFIAATATVSARPDLTAELLVRSEIIRAAREAAPQPDADLLLLDDDTRIRYETDGSYVYISDMALKILTEKGRQEKSTLQIGYSANYGSARFVRAEVIKPDGVVLPVDLAAQSREAIDQGQMSANIYDPNQKEIKLTIPGLNVGDTLRYTVAGEQTKTVVPGTWSDLFTLEETFPILHARYEVDAPAALPLIHTALKDPIKGTVTARTVTRGDRILYSWDAVNTPRLFEEPQMPAQHTVAQRLLLSTVPNWETLSKWYWDLSVPRLEKTTPAMEEKVRELVAGLSGRDEQIAAIFRFVSQEIRYMGLTIEDEAPGYEPHDVSLTFDNRYGVCRDKAALLVTMLRLAGFDARPVLIYVGPKKDPDVPQPWFNHAITAVRNGDGSWMLMDPTNENTRDLLPAYLSNRSYLVATPEGATLQTSEVIPPEKNLLTIETDAVLDAANNIRGRTVLHFNGINDTAYRGRLAALKPEERTPYFEERLKQAMGDTRLLQIDISPADVRDTTVPLAVTLEFETRNAGATGPGTSVLQVPTLVNAFGLFGKMIGEGIGLEKRRYPLNAGVTCGTEETVRLDLRPAGLRSAALPDYETIDTPELFITRSATETNGMITARASVMLRTVEFTPEQYLTLKQNLKASERNARKRAILAAGGFPSDADLAILEDEVTYTLANTGNWKEERIVRQQVLTYAGKKQLSDLRIAYNPAMEDLSLVSATVTAPDGTVKYIDPEKEINRMDAEWSASAPRYPAEKILVATLPGVEAGSIIEYRLIRICRNTPFFSASEYFSGHNPLVKKTVRVELPHDLNLNAVCTDPAAVRRKTTHRNGIIIHEWSATDRPMIRKEESMPPPWVTSPSLFLSTGERTTYAKQIGLLLESAAARNTETVRRTKALTAGLRTKLEKAIAIRDMADRAIRTAGPGLPALPPDAITPADRVLAEGYGNSTDRAVLHYAMLKAAGLKPRFILTSSLPRAEGLAAPAFDILQRRSFDTVLVTADVGNRQTITLGDTGQYAEAGASAHTLRPSLDLHDGTAGIISSDIPDSIETATAMTLTGNGDATVLKQMFFRGGEFEKFNRQYAQFTPEELRRAHQTLLSGISQSARAAGDLQLRLKSPGGLQFAAEVPAYAVRQGDRIYFTLPDGPGNLFNIKTERRDSPFLIDAPLDRRWLTDITLPEGWEPELLPPSFHVKLPSNAGFAEVQSAFSNGRLTIRQQIRITPALISAKEYRQLTELTGRLTSPSAYTILLRKKSQ